MIRLTPPIFLVFAILSYPVLSNDNNFEYLNTLAKRHLTDSIELALHYSNASVEVAKKNKDVKQLASAYWMTGYIYDLKGDIANAAQFYYGALKAYKRIDATKQIVMLLENLGTLALNQGLPDIALRAYEDRLEEVRELDDYKQTIEAHIDLGIAYRQTSNYESSIANYLIAKKLTEINVSTENYDRISRIYNGLGMTFRQAADDYSECAYYDSAMIYYNRAIEFSEKPINEFHPTNNIGNLYLKQGEYDKAIYWLSRALSMAQSMNSELLHLTPLNNLGIIHYNMTEYKLADSLFRTSLEYNLKGYSVDQIITSRTILHIDFNNLDELAVSYAYLDTLKTLVENDTYALFEKLHSQDYRQQLIKAQELRNVVAVQFEEIAREIREEKMIELARHVSIAAFILIVCALIVYYLASRLIRYMNTLRTRKLENLRQVNEFLFEENERLDERVKYYERMILPRKDRR